MRTRFLLIFVFPLVAAFFFTSGVQAQSIVNSTISGRLMSASASLTVPGPVTVFTTPEAGFFILTQFCTNAGATLRGSTFGIIVSTTLGAGGPTGPCTAAYVPGIALPQAETLSCSVELGFPGQACMITGVLSSE